MIVADDHPKVLESISRLLGRDFEVVAVASDGKQALDEASRLDPDAVVLDITMPGLDGFQTARRLRQAGLRARVVFLTMHSADEYVAEAFESGGHGYVLKTRAHCDLVSALDHVLAGRLFVPSPRSLFVVNSGEGGHGVQFYSHTPTFLDGVEGFLELALERGDVVSVVATDPIRASLANGLRARGWNVGGESGHRRYLEASPAEALSRIMRNGEPDADGMAESIAELEQIRLSVAEGQNPRVTICGEMVVPLCTAGNLEGAIELERLWNKLTHSHSFLTLCCYPLTCFSQEGDAARFPDVCDEHCFVGHGGGSA